MKNKEFKKLNNHWKTTRLNIMTIGKEYERLIKLAGYKLSRIYYELMSKQTFRINGQFCQWEYLPNLGMVRINPNLTDEDDVRETIAHELAHAVIDPNNIGHNDTWLKICRDVYHIVGIDPRKARITSDLSINILAKVKFKMTERGAEIQKSSHYRDTSIIHTKECYTTRQLNNYKKLNSSKVIDIIEIIKD